jgi:hypothetical protein
MSVALRRRYVPVLDLLEHRNLLAGNVTAIFSKGILELYGDFEPNQLSIVATGNALTLSALDDTTINGLDTSRTYQKVRGLTAFLREGDDVLEISGARHDKSWNLYMGADNDTLLLDNVRFGSKSLVALGDGDDTLVMSNSTNSQKVNYYGGSGNDVMAFSSVRGGERTVIDLGSGDDLASVTDSIFSDRFQLVAGLGDDRANVGNTRTGIRSQLDGGDGFDELGLSGNRFGKKMEIAFWQTTSSTLLPAALADSATVTSGGEVIIDLASNDFAPVGFIDPATITIVSDPLNGTVLVNGDGTVTYTHDGLGSTSDSFTYTIQDDQGNVTNVATVTITVDATASPPTAFDDFANVLVGGFVSIPVSVNDIANNGTLDLTSIVIVSPPTNGLVVVNGDGTVTYTHNGSATVSDSFTYTISDSFGAVSAAGTVFITISAAI